MKRRIFCSLILSFVMVMQSQITLAQTPSINTTVYADKTRFESQEENTEFRVEVFKSSGEKMFDSGFMAGRTLDWNMQDQQGEPVADGVYDYVVTIKNRHGKERAIQSRQLAIFREGQDLENAPTFVQLAAAPGAGGGSGNLTGSGTAGQITKWTSATTLGDSVITESSGKVGVGTTNPISLLHIIGSHPATSTLAGTNATEGLRLSGGKGGDTSGSGQTAGIGAGVVLQAGDGGDALSGTSGRGGSVTIQPGAAGVGALNGAFGQVILAPGGGNVGIGTTNAASKLTVAGMIETTLGGLRFPDGTLQTTAATSGLASVFHDVTLAGNGTSGTPLGVANGGIGNAQLGNGGVTAPKLNTFAAPSAGQVLGFDGNGLVWQAQAGFNGVTTDLTLSGNGTNGLPLRVAVPLSLSGAVATTGSILNITNTGNGGGGIETHGNNGEGLSGIAGFGIRATGGTGYPGGAGVVAQGGNGIHPILNGGAPGGDGVTALGGNSTILDGGNGVFAKGGSSATWNPGTGVRALGGDSTNGGPGTFGGSGVIGRGGSVGSGIGGVGGGFGGGDSNSGYGGTGIVANGGTGPAGNGQAAIFSGNVEVAGDFNVTGGGTKNFKIDHPLDPENKYLYHAAIESSEVLNIYSGNVTTDNNGQAVIALPNWFEAINQDLRYQLTVIGTFAQAIVGEKVKNNRFIIKTNAANVEVSWQVTGVRSDAAMHNHPFKVEQDKPERERGHYLSPDAYNQPEEKRIEWARTPELMKQMKERREQMTQKRAQK